MDALAIVLIAAAVVIAVLLAAGFLATSRRAAAGAGDYARHVAEADHALEEARAADRGWDREILEQTARSALEVQRPDFSYDELHLVLVDDRPGVVEDRAHFAAVGREGETRLVLVRGTDGWDAETVE